MSAISFDLGRRERNVVLLRLAVVAEISSCQCSLELFHARVVLHLHSIWADSRVIVAVRLGRAKMAIDLLLLDVVVLATAIVIRNGLLQLLGGIEHRPVSAGVKSF